MSECSQYLSPSSRSPVLALTIWNLFWGGEEERLEKWLGDIKWWRWDGGGGIWETTHDAKVDLFSRGKCITTVTYRYMGTVVGCECCGEKTGMVL